MREGFGGGGTVTLARSLALGRVTARSPSAEHCAKGEGAVHISQRGAAPMGACRLARKHPSGLFLSWCGRKCNCRRGAGGLRAAAEGRATAVAPLPRASARRRDAGSPDGTGLERGAQRGDHGGGGRRVSGRPEGKRAGQRGRRAVPSRKEGGKGKEGAGEPRSGVPAPCGGGCSVVQTRGRRRRFFGERGPFLGLPKVPPLPAKASTVRAELASPGCNRLPTASTDGGTVRVVAVAPEPVSQPG